MKKRIIGLGIFTLIFSLNLLLLSPFEEKQAALQHCFFSCDLDLEDTLADFDNHNSECGILQPIFEFSEIQDVSRKYSGFSGSSPFAINSRFLTVADHFVENDLSSLTPRDFVIDYHNLRI